MAIDLGHRLIDELHKSHDFGEVLHYIQNEDDFLSILIQFKPMKLRVFVLLVSTPISYSNSSIQTECEYIINDRQTFDDGTSFKSYFQDNLRLGTNENRINAKIIHIKVS